MKVTKTIDWVRARKDIPQETLEAYLESIQDEMLATAKNHGLRLEPEHWIALVTQFCAALELSKEDTRILLGSVSEDKFHFDGLWILENPEHLMRWRVVTHAISELHW